MFDESPLTSSMNEKNIVDLIFFSEDLVLKVKVYGIKKKKNAIIISIRKSSNRHCNKRLCGPCTTFLCICGKNFPKNVNVSIKISIVFSYSILIFQPNLTPLSKNLTKCNRNVILRLEINILKIL